MYTITYLSKTGKSICYPYITAITSWVNPNFLYCSTAKENVAYIIPVDSVDHIILNRP